MKNLVKGKQNVQEYVLGFLLNHNRTLVTLVEKQVPEWMKGKLNGAGGKVEPGETPGQAMHREGGEELQLWTDWKHYATLSGVNPGRQVPPFKLHAFYAETSNHLMIPSHLTTSHGIKERIVIMPIGQLSLEHCIPNVPWLIQMALSIRYDTTDVFNIQETYADTCIVG